MKINERTVIEGDRVYLVPYEEHHVKKFVYSTNGFMKYFHLISLRLPTGIMSG